MISSLAMAHSNSVVREDWKNEHLFVPCIHNMPRKDCPHCFIDVPQTRERVPRTGWRIGMLRGSTAS